MVISHHNSSFSSSTAFPSPSLLDVLYCEEEEEELWEEEGGGEREMDNVGMLKGSDNEIATQPPSATTAQNPSLLPLLFLEQDLFWEDEELLSLFSKEQQTRPNVEGFGCGFGGFSSASLSSSSSLPPSLSLARREAVEWMLKVNSYYGFSTLTAILSVNYLDRFLSRSPQFRHKENNNYNNKPWLIQLVAVTCLSLAAKVEETHVPLLLDLQVEGTKYVFEAKTIQKMELLVLSTLDWKMNTVTPISFLDYIIRRLGLKTHLHWEFLRRCERLLLSAVADSRFVRYLPSVLATSTMMHVIDQIEPSNPLDYQNQLLGVLNIGKEKVKDCYDLMVEASSGISSYSGQGNVHVMENLRKRKRSHGYSGDRFVAPSSPSGVINAYLGSDSSNESWSLSGLPSPSSSVSVSSSSSFADGRFSKKSRVREQYMPSLLGRVLADAVATASPH